MTQMKQLTLLNNPITSILQEACELGGEITQGTYALPKDTELVTKMIAKLLNFSLKVARQNGSNKPK